MQSIKSPQLDLKQLPFGRRLSRHMVYEETDSGGKGWAKGLYLAIATETVAMFGMGSFGPKGFLRIVPLFEGNALDYTYEAGVGSVLIKTAKGDIKIALDGSKNLRIAGKGIGLRFDGRVSFGENVYQKSHGIEFLKGGGIYLIKALKGEMKLDSHWDLKALHATDPIIDITPDNNAEFELAMCDTNIALELEPLAASIDDAANASEKDFMTFSEGLNSISGKYSDFLSIAAYAYWIGLYENGLASANKMNDQRYYSLQVPALALPLTDPDEAADIILKQLSYASPMGLVPVSFDNKSGLTEAVPPVYAFAVNKMLADGGIKTLPADKLSDLYAKMSKTIGWWFKKRTTAEGLSFYAFRHESGWMKYASFACDTPAATADLAAFLVLACKSLSVMASALGKPGEASDWELKAQSQLSNITDKLWNNDGFININITTGTSCSAGEIQSLFPLLLGKLLPKAITDVLVKKAGAADFSSLSIIPAVLIILGLSAMDKGAAEKAAEKLIKSCISGGANDERGKYLDAGTYFNHNASAALLVVGGSISM
jgi:hypothetical protein